jgi:hypothetical protein
MSLPKPFSQCSLSDLAPAISADASTASARALDPATASRLLPALHNVALTEAVLLRHPLVRDRIGLKCDASASSKRAWCGMLRDLAGAAGVFASDAALLRVYHVCKECAKLKHAQLCRTSPASASADDSGTLAVSLASAAAAKVKLGRKEFDVDCEEFDARSCGVTDADCVALAASMKSGKMRRLKSLYLVRMCCSWIVLHVFFRLISVLVNFSHLDLSSAFFHSATITSALTARALLQTRCVPTAVCGRCLLCVCVAAEFCCTFVSDWFLFWWISSILTSYLHYFTVRQ